MAIEDKPIEDLTKEEITDAILTPAQPSVNSLPESTDDLKKMGIRDISDADDAEAKAMQEAMKNIQIQRTLDDYRRGSTDKRTIREYLENHVNFLVKISQGKQKKDIVANLTVEHAASILKITAKMTDVPEKLLNKHIKTLKKKYS